MSNINKTLQIFILLVVIAISGVYVFSKLLNQQNKYNQSAIINIEPNTQLAQVSSTLSDGLVAHYTFDDNTNDSASSNNGTAVGGPTYVTGKIGKALQFDGVDDYVNVPDSSSLRPGAVTISFWVNLV